MRILERIKSYRLFRSKRQGLVTAVGLSVLLFSGGWAAWQSQQEPLSASEKRVLRTRVNRFANRYSPEMSDRERLGIVNGAYWSRKITALSRIEHGLWFSGIVAVFLIITLWRWWFLLRMTRTSGFFLHVNQVMMALSIIILVVTMGQMLWIGRGTRPIAAVMDAAGGWTDEGRIVLSKGNQRRIQNTDQLILIFDHELTHLFGRSKYQKIKRDCWLSYAYPAVLALERGGFPMLQKEESLNTAEKYPLAWYTEGVFRAGGTFPPVDPEAEFIKAVGLKLPINPEATDDSFDPSAGANQVFDYGIAGIAWYLSAGNGDIALSYLDDRSNGIPPLEAREKALERVQLADQKHDGGNQIRTSKISGEAFLYRIKLDREERKLNK